MVVVAQDGGDGVLVHLRMLDVVCVDETDGGTPEEVHLLLGYCGDSVDGKHGIM